MSDTTPSEITEKAQRLRVLMDGKDRLEARLKEVNAELKQIKEKDLPRLMENAEIEKVTIAGAGSLFLKQEVFVSMVKDTDDEGSEAPFYDYARENAPDLISDYIHPARLKAWVKEKLEAGEHVPDNSLKVTLQEVAQLRRAK